MWVESLSLENIKCFDRQDVTFAQRRTPRSKAEPYPWITMLGENGTGKSTLLQSLALLLAGPEAAKELLPRPAGWAREPMEFGKIGAVLHGGTVDMDLPYVLGESPPSKRYPLSYIVTGSRPVKLDRETYTEPVIVEEKSKALSWLRANAFSANWSGWFAAGYGPFRRLSRTNSLLVPSLTLDPPTRASNFATMFDENRGLNTFEQWMLYLDYRTARSPRDARVKEMRAMGEAAINRLLPENTRIVGVSESGQIQFEVNGRRVPSADLSDGYSSVVALAGDLIWRLLQVYPALGDLAHISGVVLIDEIDIHLHPSWQRQIAPWLRSVFPRLQFIVATHSPLIAIGAGEDACTLRLEMVEGATRVTQLEDLSAFDADRALRSPAFGLESTHSPDTEAKIARYHELRQRNGSLDDTERQELAQLEQFMAQAQPIGGPPEPGSLEARINAYLEAVLP